jgi:DNA adenine methylase
MASITQPIKYCGGKNYLARRIIDLFPPHIHYVEPFFGGGSVLLQRDTMDERFWVAPHKGVSEVVNDVDGELMNFWRVLQTEEAFGVFARIVEAIPLARAEWDWAALCSTVEMDSPIDRAIRFFVHARQSRAGDQKAFTPLTRTRTRRGMNGNASEWLGAVEGMADVHARLKRVVVENLSALEVIEREDTSDTLFYCDPPYLHETRTSKKLYRYEMTEDQHASLLNVLIKVEGKVILSGYPSGLYKEALESIAGWRFVDFDLPNNQAGGKSKRRMTERVWMNF